ncbi:MAG: AtpZ/AtpI family protein [Candidatus Pacebacteria bacterium]|nr:AtpZ/AtpI family protein [Candidatus Paceibacterota bacterium]
MAAIEKQVWRQALLVFGRMSGWVATPILLAVFLGRWMDAKRGTENLWFFIFVGVGFFISSYGIFKEAKKYQISMEVDDLKAKQSNGDTENK